MKARFYWDFFGPRAQGTAQHFERHLLQFLEAHCLSLDIGTSQESDHHVAVFCDLPDLPRALQENLASDADAPTTETVADQIGRTLRPNRLVEHTES